MTTEPRDDVILKLGRDMPLAHRVLFGHRHGNETPPYHDEHIAMWHSPVERFLEIVFRGGAKSTRAEEAITLEACFQQFKNCIILGENEARAVDRLRAIKHELNTNPYIEELFGDLGEGSAATWGDARVVLANGVCIQAYGREQSLRGVKHLDQRPDLLFFDDLEDADSVATPEARKKLSDRFFAVVLPALAPPAERRIRGAGTPLDPDCLLEHLARDERWHARRVPIKYRDASTGDWCATWPGRFPLKEIDKIETELRDHGKSTLFMQEYMCQAEDQAQKTFRASMFRIEPTVRTWHAVFAMVDPARTVKARSATTGVAIWSWVNRRLVIWDAYGQRWRPDEIVADLFRINDEYGPVTIGVEEDGLNEFILQPVRQEQVKRGYAIPFKALRAPKGKIDFIKGLQPFFNAGEVIWAKELPDLRSQLLSFPTGDIDVPNALAYALRLRPGTPMYDGFGVQHIVEGDMILLGRDGGWLAVNATTTHTTAALVQVHDNALRVLADWVREGDPGTALPGIVAEAGVESGRTVRVVCGPRHFDAHDTIGLRGAAARIPVLLRRGGDEKAGREEMRARMARTQHGQAQMLVSTQARWTLNGLAAGYARQTGKGGVLSEEAEEGPYRTLIEGIEAFAAVLRAGMAEEDDQRRYATAPDGRRYLSSLAQR